LILDHSVLDIGYSKKTKDTSLIQSAFSSSNPTQAVHTPRLAALALPIFLVNGGLACDDLEDLAGHWGTSGDKGAGVFMAVGAVADAERALGQLGVALANGDIEGLVRGEVVQELISVSLKEQEQGRLTGAAGLLVQDGDARKLEVQILRRLGKGRYPLTPVLGQDRQLIDIDGAIAPFRAHA